MKFLDKGLCSFQTVEYDHVTYSIEYINTVHYYILSFRQILKILVIIKMKHYGPFAAKIRI